MCFFLYVFSLSEGGERVANYVLGVAASNVEGFGGGGSVGGTGWPGNE